MRVLRIVLGVLAVAALTDAQTPDRLIVSPEVGANLPAQPIGPNDLIGVFVYGAPELSRTIRVGSDGLIRVPMLKRRIRAEGLQPAELEAAIMDALDEEAILVDAFVTVTIAEYHSRPISVAGAVKKPVVFQASAPVTLLEAIARAEGLRADAGAEILVSRPGPDAGAAPMTRRIPVRSLIDGADASLNLQLSGGEEVRVPEVNKIYVIGNVRKPGAFPVQNGGETTVLEMLALAEGLAPYATKDAYIYRREASGTKTEIPIQLEKIMKRQSPDVALAANDILYIPDNKGKRATISTLDRIASFGATTATGVIVYH